MDKKTKGSWLIHHTNKLQAVVNQNGFEATYLAGKAGILLSSVSATEETTINNEKVRVLAQASNINIQFELPSLLAILKARNLIDTSTNGIAVLGVTTTSALQHTADIFDNQTKRPAEEAAVELAEITSREPILIDAAGQLLADKYEIDKETLNGMLREAEDIGFVDVEMLGKDKLLFNGNLFRRDDIPKTRKILDTLTAQESQSILSLNEQLKKQGCIEVSQVRKQLGDKLFEKVISVSMYDISVVSNSQEDTGYVTLPSAFSKFGNSMVEDAFDLTKAFLSSLTYGMTKSSYSRGQITMVERLLQALVAGRSVGPVEAIGQDYKMLELKGVVSVRQGSRNGRTGPMMRLLKREVGELALQVIKSGDVSEHSLNLPGASITSFKGPETNREVHRRTQRANNPKATNDMLAVLRTGKIF